MKMLDLLIRDCGVKSSSIILIVVFGTFLSAMPVFGTTHYVATSGNDANPGTESDPWQTIQKAADTLVAGDTVYIRAGTYNERVIPENSGSAGSYITYAAYPGETVTIDGNGVSVPEDEGLFYIHGKSYIKVSSLRVVNSVQAGIYVDASSNNITIQGNYTNNTGSSGIGVWNSSSIIIDGNEVESSCSNGWQENITVAGTSSFEVKNNHVHNEGSDYKKEGICLKDGSANGKAYGNHVHHTWKVGIYVDAWDKHTYNIDIFQNIVHDSRNDGITVASEMGGLLENVKIYNNISYNNSLLGISVSRNGPASTQVQPLHNIKVINNTVYNNGLSGWGGGISVGNPDVQDIIFRNNICSQNLSFQILVPVEQLTVVTVDHNLIDGFRGYTEEQASEIRGSDYVEGDPKFVDASGADFHLQGSSPAIDKGSPLNAPTNDYDGNIRPYGSGYDIGAYEYGATPPDSNLNPNPPNHPARLIFIHHSTGENWLNDENGGLGIALRDNNYYVSDTNYGWGPDSIGDRTDIGNWWEWFRGTDSATYLNALYNEGEQHCSYSRSSTAAPSGENEVIMFKSCFPNSALQGNPNDPVPSIDNNPLKGEGSGSENHTVANAKGIYIDLLEYFRTRQDKLFIVITAPPLMANDTNAAQAANARTFNNWLVNEWLVGYPYNNVFVFDFYNVLTSNGGNANTNDVGSETGNHHRWWNGTIQHIQTVNNNKAAYPSGDSHPSQAGNLKATGEFLPLLNVAYHRWKVEVVETVSTPSTPSGSTSGIAGTSYTYSTDGAISSLGHSVQYLFYWGDGTNSGWLPVGQTSASKSWDCSGTYTVTGLARCATDTFVVSGLSSGLSVNISGCTETVSTPNAPSGPDSGIIDTDYSFTADGAISSLGHSIEYRFDWGDGTLSDWSSLSEVSKSWSDADNYLVRAQARCANHPSIESGWSDPFTVTISAVGPDLTGSWTVPVTQTCKKTSRGQKCTIKGTFTANNIGNRDASSTYVGFYLSDDDTYDEGDTQLKQSSTGKIKVGRSKSIKLSYSFPVGQTATNKYIIAVIDGGNSVAEIDETNNIKASDSIP